MTASELSTPRPFVYVLWLVLWLVFWFASGTFAFTPSAFAQTRSSEAEARSLTIEAKAAFDEGRFGEAAELLVRAYDIKPSSVLLYNLGRAYQQAGDKARAVEAYRRYLASESSPPDEGAVRRTVQRLEEEMAHERALAERLASEQARADREAAERRAAQSERQEAQEQARHKASAIPWIVAGVGVSGLAAGGVLGVLANGEHDAAASEPMANAARTKQDTAESLATYANVAFVVGGALTALGVVWGFFDLRAASSWKPKTAITVGPGSIGIRGEL